MRDTSALPSNKTFGLFFTAVFSIAAGFALYKSASVWLVVMALLALATLSITLVSAKRLTPFNKAWLALGLFLAKIISPIVLGILFFVLITPVALVMRLARRDELRLQMRNEATHWKQRTPVGPEPDSFKHQF